MGAQRVTSDIVEDLHSADPECEPSAAKIIMGRAAGEIERLRAALAEQHDRVAAEREAILDLIESKRADAHMYDGDYCLRTVAAAIRARGNQSERG
jgi:hypothetical protein